MNKFVFGVVKEKNWRAILAVSLGFMYIVRD
jgi:hypothetical protein